MLPQGANSGEKELGRLGAFERGRIWGLHSGHKQGLCPGRGEPPRVREEGRAGLESPEDSGYPKAVLFTTRVFWNRSQSSWMKHQVNSFLYCFCPAPVPIQLTPASTYSREFCEMTDREDAQGRGECRA